MKVLLVYPEFPDTFWSFKHALPFQGKRSAFPPLGLLTISAMLPKHWEKRLVDLNVQRLKDSELDLGRRRVLQRHDCARALDARTDCARQTARQAHGGGRPYCQRP